MIQKTLGFVAFVAMVAGFFAYIGSLGIRVGPPTDRINLSMDVSDVNNLVVDSNVLVRGVPVGKVSGIEASASHATVHFYLQNGSQVPVDSTVKLENLSALGESYIELEPLSNGGRMFRDGERIAPDAVAQPPSISELGASVVRVLNQADPGQLQRVIGEADAALPDPYAVLPNLERTSLLLRNTTRDLNGQGGRALQNIQTLLENAGFVGPALGTATPDLYQFGPHLKGLWINGTSINLRVDSPGQVYIFGKFLARIQKLLDDRSPDIRVLTEPLTANINAIAASLQTIDSSQVLTNLLAAVPEDGAINLHVTIPDQQPGN